MKTGQRLYRYYKPDPHVSAGNCGTHSYEMARKDAENGSEMLRERIDIAFHRFAQRYHITPEEAQILLLDTGVRLPPSFMLRGRR